MEIIERKIKATKRVIDPSEHKLQVAYNSFGHLVLRFFEEGKEDEDVIIVFTAEQTREIARFIIDRNIPHY